MTIIPFFFFSLSFFLFPLSSFVFRFFLDLVTGRTPCPHVGLPYHVHLPYLPQGRKKRIALSRQIREPLPGPLPTAASPWPPMPVRGTQLLPLPLPSILFHSVSSSCPLPGDADAAIEVGCVVPPVASADHLPIFVVR
jgi:hypothetical protein